MPKVGAIDPADEKLDSERLREEKKKLKAKKKQQRKDAKARAR